MHTHTQTHTEAGYVLSLLLCVWRRSCGRYDNALDNNNSNSNDSNNSNNNKNRLGAGVI